MRCAIVGYGYWGKIVEKYVKESEHLQLVGICEPHLPETVKLETLVEEKKIDAAIVCTPIATHFEITRYLLEHGIHVFCEKPLCKESVKVRKLYEIAREKGVLLYTDYIYTVSPSINALKTFLKENEHKLGQAVYMNMVIEQFGRFYPEDDVFAVIGVHMLSVIAYVFDTEPGDIRILSSTPLRKNKTGLTEAGIVQFAVGNMTGKIECSLLSHDKKRRIEVLCESGLLVFDMLGEHTIQVFYHVEEEGAYREELLCQFCYDESNNLKAVFDAFAAAAETMDMSNEKIAIQVAESLEQIK